MSVSRDFIDSCSPEAPAWAPHRTRRGPSPFGELTQASAQCGGTTLVFGFLATSGFEQRVDMLAQDWLPLPLPLEGALRDWRRPVTASPLSRPARPAADPAPVLNFVLKAGYDQISVSIRVGQNKRLAPLD